MIGHPDDAIRIHAIVEVGQATVLEIILPDEACNDEVFGITISEFTASGQKNDMDTYYKTRPRVWEDEHYKVIPWEDGQDDPDVADVDNKAIYKFLDDDGIVTYVAEYGIIPAVALRVAECNGYSNKYGDDTQVICVIPQGGDLNSGYIARNNNDDIHAINSKVSSIRIEILHYSTLTNEKLLGVRPDRKIYFTNPYTMKILLYQRPRRRPFR